jgi:hypothetical protein
MFDQSVSGKNTETFFTRWKNLSLPTQVRFHWWNVWTNETAGITPRLSLHAGKISASPPRLDFIGGMFGPMRQREEHQDFLHTGEKSQPSHPGKISLVE